MFKVIGVAFTRVPPAAVGTAEAVSTADPLIDGFQVQVAIKGEVALVNLFLQPGMIVFRALKVTLEAVLTFAVIVTTWR